MESIISEWKLINPVNIIFGKNSISSLQGICKDKRVIILTSKGFLKRGVIRKLNNYLKGDQLVGVFGEVIPNPTPHLINSLTQKIKNIEADYIIALGGGSCIDAAKCISALINSNKCSIQDLIHKDNSIDNQKIIDVIAVPTTSGTGSEVTPFATIWDNVENKKYSLVGDDIYVAHALCDPMLTIGMPWEVTLCTGLDAIAHSLESIWNRNANLLTLRSSMLAFQMAKNSLPALKNDDNELLRTNMMAASLLAGLSISQTKTAISHSISYPITSHLKLNHGFAASFTLPEILLWTYECDNGNISKLLNYLNYKNIFELYDSINDLFIFCDVGMHIKEKIKDYKLLPAFISQMYTAGRMDNCIRIPNNDDIKKILTGAYKKI